MKTLTLTQPWATLVAIGAKRIETRSWSTSFRGTMAIHAATGFPKWARQICDEFEFARELGPNRLPTGAILCTCRLISCIPTRELQENRVIQVDYLAGCGDFLLDDNERRFGDYALGRWAWLLADVRPYPTPIPIKGKLGLWEWREADAPMRVSDQASAAVLPAGPTPKTARQNNALQFHDSIERLESREAQKNII